MQHELSLYQLHSHVVQKEQMYKEKKETQWVYELLGGVNQEHETTITSFSDTTTIFFIEEEDLDAWLTTSIFHQRVGCKNLTCNLIIDGGSA